MTKACIAVPVVHTPRVCEIQTEPVVNPRPVTLLELIDAVSEVAESEHEVLATVMHMLNSGNVRLSGCFRDTPIEKLCG